MVSLYCCSVFVLLLLLLVLLLFVGREAHLPPGTLAIYGNLLILQHTMSIFQGSEHNTDINVQLGANEAEPWFSKS